MSMATPTAQETDLKEGYRDESSDAESDFENDPVSQHARSSIEIAEHDRGLLDEEEEREKLLAAGGAQKVPSKGFFDRRKKDKKLEEIELNENERKRRRSHKTRREKKGGGKDEEGELLYEMEEGGDTYDTSSQASSSSADLDKLNLAHSSMSKVIFRVHDYWKKAHASLTAPKVGSVAHHCYIDSSPLRSPLIWSLQSDPKLSATTSISPI